MRNVDEMIAAYSLLSPNKPCVVYELDEKNKLVARIVWHDKDVLDQSLPDPYEVKINGTRAVSLAIQRLFVSVADQGGLDTNELELMQKQEYQNLIPNMFKSMSSIGKAAVWSPDHTTRINSLHRRSIVDEGHADRIELFSMVVLKEFKRALGNYKGDELALTKSLIRTGMLQIVLQSIRLTHNEEYQMMQPVMDLFINSCAQAIEEDDIEMLFLMKNILPTLREFIHFTSGYGLFEQRNNEGNLVGNYDVFARFSRILENVPQQVFNDPYGLQVKFTEYNPKDPLGYILTGDAYRELDPENVVLARRRNLDKIKQYLSRVSSSIRVI